MYRYTYLREWKHPGQSVHDTLLEIGHDPPRPALVELDQRADDRPYLVVGAGLLVRQQGKYTGDWPLLWSPLAHDKVDPH